jgi:4-amino-4-deoxy-L-arabinose transferase-like glycosyltransferase
MKKINWLLISILVIGSLFRLPYLETHMVSLYGDEIAIGYNAYSILKTGRDEFGNFMPLQFKSWGDQKNPVYIYAVSLVQLFLGPTSSAVRFPSALAGILAIYLTYRLVLLLKLGKGTAYFAAFLLALTPWHIHISRGGYEANLALTLGLASVVALLSKRLVPSVIYLVLATYTYYTTKMFAPLLLGFVWFWSNWNQKLKVWLKPFATYWLMALILALPIIYLAVFAGGQARFSAINIFTNKNTVNQVIRDRNFFSDPNSLVAKALENKSTYYFLDFLTNYFDNFSGQFLFVGGDSNIRYGLINHGMLYLLDAPLIFMGILILYRKNRKAWLLLISWLLLAPLPTALVGKAYGLRSLAMMPVLQIFAAVSLSELYLWSKQNKTRLMVLVLGSLLYLGSVSNWLIRYIYQYPIYGRYWYDSAVKESIDYAKSREDQYDNIIISNAYGKTDIYFAYYEQISPEVYKSSQDNPLQVDGVPATKIGKYYFADLRPNARPPEQLDLPKNSLIIGDPHFPFGDATINGLDDGRVLFKIYETAK